ncbi:hypothetical protein [[Pseudomonas] boreopolis]|uniref:DOD-type homing endonuclease domain-containing protein n=1 Tax=Xanthomonas boreopolis TaxID=86183 RepID=A0A919F7M4_9XANT|nr:hypothetical protein GCM10009090_16140 [[Pseudomonas] boreopolis]
MTDPYREFLERKIKSAPSLGFQVALGDINPLLNRHQPDAVQWACAGGRRALFERFGLGKSVQQIEILRLARAHAGGPVGLVLPLGVRQELARDAHMLATGENGRITDEQRVQLRRWIAEDPRRAPAVRFVRCTDEVDPDFEGIHLTNYESVRDGKLDPNVFTAASLDEASVLRSFGSKTYQQFLTLFDQVRYRFVATATPSPNRYKELIHYAGYLGIMDTGQALTRWFKRDSTQANNLTLYPHKEREFWLWVASWALFLQRPSDLGYSDEGYDLPELTVHYVEVPVDHTGAGTERDGQGKLFRDAALGVVDAAREKRDTIPARVAAVRDIVESRPTEHWLIWHDLEAERHALQAAIPDAVSIFGDQDLEEREQAVIDFSEGRIAKLSAKPVIAGSGCNFQRHCHLAVFAGIGHKFNDFIQAIYRIQRFQQPFPVEIWIVYAESEREVLSDLLEKWKRDTEMRERMSEIIKQYGLSEAAMAQVLTRSIGVERIEASGQGWLVANNDCVEETRRMAENSVDLIVTSIPFSNHYEYSPSYNDFGHTDDNAHFWAQMDHLTPELLRVLRPGRIAAIHVKDRIQFGNVTGAGLPTVSPFHAETIFHYRSHGFDYLGMITVVTDVVRENNQTYRLSYSEMLKDGTKMGVGSPEYVILLHKPQTDRSRGYADQPVSKGRRGATDYSLARWQIDAHAFWRSSGNRMLTADELAQLGPDKLAKLYTEYSLRDIYDYETHVRIGEELEARGALPSSFMSLAPGSHHPDVWHDVNRMLTLNGEQTKKGLENHICLARDSRVLTKERGYVPIQDVRVGEHTLTHMGRWRPVLAVRKTADSADVVTLRAQGVPGITLTPTHKIWTRQVSGKKRERDAAENATPEWVPAADVEGDYVNLKLPPVDDDGSVDGRTWWIVGRWLADGHRDAHGAAVISCGRHEVEEMLSVLGDLAAKPVDTGTAIQIRLRDPRGELRTILDECGRGVTGKHLPPRAFTLSKDNAGELLSGYLAGDGHYNPIRQRWSTSSVSRDLLLGIAVLAQRVHDTVPTLYAGRGERRGAIQGREVQMRQDWILSFDDVAKVSRKRPFILDDGAWKKVSSVTPAGQAETWNLHVAEDNSYTAEGLIVKNCPLQFDIVDRLIERYSSPGEEVYDPFGGLFTVPYRALKLGRRGRASELNTGYFMDGVRYLQAMERELAMPDLFATLEPDNQAHAA